MENQELKDELLALEEHLQEIWGKLFDMKIKAVVAYHDIGGKAIDLVTELDRSAMAINSLRVEIFKFCKPEDFATTVKRISKS